MTSLPARIHPGTRGLLGLLVGLCLLPGLSTTTSAQTAGGPRPVATAPRDFGFLTGFRTAFDVSHLTGTDADERFNWDAALSVDVDVVDAGHFRGNLFVGVETIVGSELRAVDPNQNNYVVDTSVFVRLPRGELMTTFHHVSRHLGDRATRESISWNMVGVGYGHSFTAGGLGFDAGGRALWTVERAGVDYDTQLDGYVEVSRSLTDRYALIARAEGINVTVHPLELGHDNRRGGRVEGGLRIATGIAKVDLFIAREQRIDASSGLRDLTQWTQFGIRLVTAHR